MVDNNGRGYDRSNIGQFSYLMIGAAALILVILLIAGGVSGFFDSPDSPIEATTTTEVDITEKEQDELIDELSGEIADLENKLSTANKEIAALRSSSDISSEVLEQLRQSVETTSNPTTIYNGIIERLAEVGISCLINPETNSLRFDEKLLFASSSASLIDSDQEFLNDLLPLILSEIEFSGQSGSIEQIIFAGYADDGGSLTLNLELSQNRAEAVLDYLLQANLITFASGDDDSFAYACAGMADQRPVLSDGVINRDLSRRVEIAIILDNRNISDTVFGNE